MDFRRFKEDEDIKSNTQTVTNSSNLSKKFCKTMPHIKNISIQLCQSSPRENKVSLKGQTVPIADHKERSTKSVFRTANVGIAFSVQFYNARRHNR